MDDFIFNSFRNFKPLKRFQNSLYDSCYRFATNKGEIIGQVCTEREHIFHTTVALCEAMNSQREMLASLLNGIDHYVDSLKRTLATVRELSDQLRSNYRYGPNFTCCVTSRSVTTRDARHDVTFCDERVALVVRVTPCLFQLVDDEKAVVLACRSLIFWALDLHQSQELLEK